MITKLTVWPPPPTKPDKELFVQLSQLDKNDEVVVQLVDETGTIIPGGNIMILTTEGYYPCGGVHPLIGVAVDATKNFRMMELCKWPR